MEFRDPFAEKGTRATTHLDRKRASERERENKGVDEGVLMVVDKGE